MRISWLTPRISLLLSALSVLAAYVGAFALGAYMLVLLTIPAVILFVLSLKRYHNVHVSRGGHLSSELADTLVNTAVDPREYPLCAHLTVTHSNGVAIAAMIARVTLTSIKHLQKMLFQRVEEMQGELMFTREVVERHLTRLQRIQSIASVLVSGGNLQSRCYCEIPDAAGICNVLDEVRKKLDHDVIQKMQHFGESIPEDTESPENIELWRERIRTLIQVEIPSVLTEVLESLYKVEKPANKLVKKLETDWERDLRFLWEDHLCKPCPESIPKKQITVPDFLFSTD